MNGKVDQILAEVLGLNGCDQHHNVQLEANLYWYTPGENIRANIELLNTGIFTNGLNNRTEWTLGKSVDTTKLGGVIDAQDGGSLI